MRNLYNIIWGLALSSVLCAAPISISPSIALANGTVIDNFSYTRTASAAICTPAGGDGIDVSSTGNTLLIAAGFAASGGVCDHLISFDVTAPDGVDLIGLTFNGAATGTAFAQVTETVRDENGVVLNQRTVDTSGVLQANIPFAARNKIRVTKDIMLVAADGIENHATISFIEQEFQTSGVSEVSEVPESSTFLLTGSFLLLVARLKR